MVYVYVPVFWGIFLIGMAIGRFFIGDFITLFKQNLGDLRHDQGHGNNEYKCELRKKQNRTKQIKQNF